VLWLLPSPIRSVRTLEPEGSTVTVETGSESADVASHA